MSETGWGKVCIKARKRNYIGGSSSAENLSPFLSSICFPGTIWTCPSKIPGTGQMRPIGEAEAYVPFRMFPYLEKIVYQDCILTGLIMHSKVR